MNPALIITIAMVAFVILLIRLAHGSKDEDRIRSYFAHRNEKLLKIEWAPTSPGAWADRRDRYYQVTYLDAQGHEHRATCRTSGWTGVYLTEPLSPPTAVTPPPLNPTAPTPDLESRLRQLEQENARLRAQLSHPQDPH